MTIYTYSNVFSRSAGRTVVLSYGAHFFKENAGRARRFVLKDVRIEGALLTATKRYDDGATEKFEGVFIKQTEFNSPTDKGVTSYGIGALVQPVKDGEDRSKRNKLFYQRQK